MRNSSTVKGATDIRKDRCGGSLAGKMAPRVVALLLCASLVATVRAASGVEHPSLLGQHLVGYQGWFGCPGDKPRPGWYHWSRAGRNPAADTLTVDLWPDTSELTPAERCATGLKLPSGEPAWLFSSSNPDTVRRHFTWMRKYDIDGAALERFVVETADRSQRSRPDTVLSNVRAAAEAEGRGFLVMYDLSGMSTGKIVAAVERDWQHLSVDLSVLKSPAYIHHRGHPVIGLWGPGFTEVALTPAEALELQRFFRAQGLTILGGTPSHWRTLDGDSLNQPAWAEVYRGYDVISPWLVGRMASPADADRFAASVMAGDIAATKQAGQDYMPVVFPGFSWHNLKEHQTPLDQIPRRCGAFYREEVADALNAGAQMLYTAMFDEVDEGTAIFKVVRTPAALPTGVQLLAPDSTSCDLATDSYLQAAAAATRALRENTEKRGNHVD